MTTEDPLRGLQNLECISHFRETENLETIPLPSEPVNLEDIPLAEDMDATFSSSRTLISGEEAPEREDLISKEFSLEREPMGERHKLGSLSQPSMHFASRSQTLPANTGSKIECKILDIDNLPKLSRWDTFKNKLYLSSAFGATRRMTTMKESKCCASRLDLEGTSSQEHDYSTIEGLDLGGLPPMSHKSRKLFSWSKFMQGVRGKKGKDVLDTKNEDESEATNKVQKKFSIAWFQKKFLQGKGSNADAGIGNGEISETEGDEEMTSVSNEDTSGPKLEEVM